MLNPEVVKSLVRTSVSQGAAFAFGVAVGPALAPEVRFLINEAWSHNPTMPPDVGALAIGVSQGQVDEKRARGWAKEHGIGDDAFTALVGVANTGPGVPIAFDLWRRGIIGEPGFRRAAKRQGIEPEWIDDLVKTFHVPLEPADLARGIHRGLVPDPGLLKGNASPGPGKVAAYPQYDIDALAEALVAGLDKDHLGVLVGLQGNPMGAHEAAQAFFRGILEENDYLRAIAEGNTRNEWADAILEQTRQIPTARDFFENALRGYHDLPWALEQAKRHGMTEADATVIYQNQGRPMALHQIVQGLARGGKFKPEPGEITDPFMASIVEGSLKPAYYDLAHAGRYSYPSPNYFRLLQTSGVLTPAEAEQRYLEIGWEPSLAKQVANALGKQRGGAAKEATATDLLTLYDGGRRTRAETITALADLGYPADEAETKVDVLDARKVASARTTAIADLHTKYKKGELPDANVLTALAALGVADWAAPQIVAAWRVFLTAEAATPVSQLPPTLSAFAPASGPAGTAVTLTGTFLGGATAVTLGAVAATFNVASDTEIRATVPAGAITGQWTVKTPGGTASAAGVFTVA